MHEQANLLSRYRLLLLGGFLLVLYAATFSGVSSVDAYYYYENIETGRFELLCHPHHLVYLPIAAGWFELWQMLGYTGNAFLPVKLLSLFGVVGALAGFARILQLLFGRGLVTVTLFFALGFSYLPWHYATEGEPVIFFQCFSIWILYFLVRMRARPRAELGDGWRLGLAVAVGALFHQALAFAIVLVAPALWFRAGPGKRWPILAVFLGVTAAVVGIPYIWVGCVLQDGFNLRQIILWATGYLEEFSGAYGPTNLLKPRLILTGWIASFVGGGALKPYLAGGLTPDWRYRLALVPHLLMAGILGVGMAMLVGRWRRLEKEQRDLLFLVALFTLLYLAAAVYWEPGSRKFWAPVQPGLLLLAGAGLVTVNRGRKRLRHLVFRPEALLVLLAATLLIGNLTGGILHKHRARDPEHDLALGLLEVFQPGDLLVLRGSRLWQSVSYHYPEVHSVPVMNYVNPVWAAADTTLDHAAGQLWETLRRGKTGYVSSAIQSRLAAALEKTTPEFAAGRADRLERTLFLRFSDFEQDPRVFDLYSWRWTDTD